MKKRVLIVEDNEKNRELEKDVLELAGFEVIEAADAASAITMARCEKFDVIIMDILLPDMRGTKAAFLLRQDKQTASIPIVFVTASVLEEGTEDIKGVGNCGYLVKPINTRTFAKEIGQYIK